MTHRHDDEDGDQSIDQRSITYKVISSILIVVILGLVGVVYTAMNNQASNAEARVEKKFVIMDSKIDGKVSQEQYDRQMDKIDGYMREIRQTLHDHEANSRKRNGN